MSIDLKLYDAIKDSGINLILSLPCIMLKGLLQLIEEKNEISKKFPEITENLKKLLEDWRISIEAKIPQTNPNYNLE